MITLSNCISSNWTKYVSVIGMTILQLYVCSITPANTMDKHCAISKHGFINPGRRVLAYPKELTGGDV